jgi:hypothetical protein
MWVFKYHFKGHILLVLDIMYCLKLYEEITIDLFSTSVIVVSSSTRMRLGYTHGSFKKFLWSKSSRTNCEPKQIRHQEFFKFVLRKKSKIQLLFVIFHRLGISQSKEEGMPCL